MTMDEAERLSHYRQIGEINASHSVFLVEHDQSHQLYVKKILTLYNRDLLESLRSAPLPGTPGIIDMIEDQNHLIVIEAYISGKTLQSLITRQGAMSLTEAVSVMQKLCPIVQALHEKTPPVIHRDIKPENILMDRNGSLTLVDMNAAKYYASEKSADTQLLGTVGYAAPEQYGFGASDVQADIYATGVLLNEMLTGDKPSVKQATDSFRFKS